MAINNVLIQECQGATNGYNQINPLIVDEDLNTRIGFASGSTSKDIINYNSQFWWKRRSIENQWFFNIVDVSAPTSTSNASQLSKTSLVCGLGATDLTFKYSDNYTFNQNTGEIVLNNPETFSIDLSDAYNNNYRYTQFNGKYVQQNLNRTVGDILYLSSSVKECVPHTESGLDGKYYLVPYGDSGVTGVQKLTSTQVDVKGDWEIVKANLETAYPLVGELNGYEYNYIGNPLKDWKNMAKIDQGTYIGTGTGIVSLVFEFQPKMVVISPKVPNNSQYGSSILAVNLTSKYSSFYINAGTGGDWYTTAEISFSWENKKFSATWDFSSSLNKIELDEINIEYVYVAFG